MLKLFRNWMGPLLTIALTMSLFGCREKGNLEVDFHPFTVQFPDFLSRDFHPTSPPEWYIETKPNHSAFAQKEGELTIIASYSKIPETIDSNGRIKFIDLLSDVYFHPAIPINMLAVDVQVDSNSFNGQYYVEIIPDYPNHFGFLSLIQLDEHLLEVLIIKNKEEHSLIENWQWVNENKEIFKVLNSEEGDL